MGRPGSGCIESDREALQLRANFGLRQEHGLAEAFLFSQVIPALIVGGWRMLPLPSAGFFETVTGALHAYPLF